MVLATRNSPELCVLGLFLSASSEADNGISIAAEGGTSDPAVSSADCALGSTALSAPEPVSGTTVYATTGDGIAVAGELLARGVLTGARLAGG